MDDRHPWLRRFSKLTCFSTLFLIFVGSLVTSTGSGSAVPDWPLSYGTLFPPMVGGIFYEHGHRMVASLVGLFMLILAVWLACSERKRWVRNLGFAALIAVILQGVLGGITVLFFLPTLISVIHGVLAQTFFLLTIFIAYSQSLERKKKENFGDGQTWDRSLLKISLLFVVCVYVQLILGAVMRHTHAGLAIPDFPKMGGMWVPSFDAGMLATINSWRFEMNLDPATMTQVIRHFLHRLGAGVILIVLVALDYNIWRAGVESRKFVKWVLLINFLVVIQIFLGVMTVLSEKNPFLASVHVLTGAAILGAGMLLFLKVAPLSIQALKKKLNSL